jgi:hypothetical protein
MPSASAGGERERHEDDYDDRDYDDHDCAHALEVPQRRGVQTALNQWLTFLHDSG